MIVHPEQYEVNKMEQGDIVYVLKRPLIYKFLRKHFLQNKEQIKVKKDFLSNEYNTYYREDCILIYKYELLCTETYNNIDYFITKSGSTIPKKQNLKSLTINLYNLQILLEDNTSITIPLDKIKMGIQNTERMLREIDRQEIVNTQIKFMRYKGDYFKKLVKQQNIKKLNIMFCSICGGSVFFNFKKDYVDVINKCKCGNTKLDLRTMTYDEFAMWYASQTEDNYKRVINEQLFKQEGVN